MGLSNYIPNSRISQAGVIANASERPVSPYTGQMVYQTDTKQLLIWNGTAWVDHLVADAIDAKGDLLAGTADNTIGRVAVGANNQRLIANSSATAGVSWVADTQNTVVDAKGDLLAGTADNTIARLGVGANNQVLAANSGTTTGLEWVDRPWNVAWGVRAYNSVTTPDTSITSEEVQITGSSFTAVTGRLYKVTYFEPDVFPNPGSGYLRARIRLTNISGTVLGECYEQLETSGTTNRFVNLVWFGTISAGTTNVVATLFISGATGYASRDASAKAHLVVEDIGPA